MQIAASQASLRRLIIIRGFLGGRTSKMRLCYVRHSEKNISLLFVFNIRDKPKSQYSVKGAIKIKTLIIHLNRATIEGIYPIF